MKRNFTTMGIRELFNRIMWYRKLLDVEMKQPSGNLHNIRRDLYMLGLEYDARLFDHATIHEINLSAKSDIEFIGKNFKMAGDFFFENEN